MIKATELEEGGPEALAPFILVLHLNGLVPAALAAVPHPVDRKRVATVLRRRLRCSDPCRDGQGKERSSDECFHCLLLMTSTSAATRSASRSLNPNGSPVGLARATMVLRGQAFWSFATRSRRDVAEADIGRRAPGPRFDEIADTIRRLIFPGRTRLISSMN